MKPTFHRITSPSDLAYERAQALYHTSFPACERREEDMHILTLGDRNFAADTIYISDMFAGILYYWHWDEFSFIEHFATEPELRGQGIGGLALDEWKIAQQGRVMLLEIEPPIDDITSRREAFYMKHGFITNSYLHMHPSYSSTTEPHQLLVMSAPGTINEEQFKEFQRYSFSHIIRWRTN